MVQPQKKIKDSDAFKRGLLLLKNNQDSKACLVFARIAGWNYSQKVTPLQVVNIWNETLPSKLKINIDAFDDKGKAPQQMTKEEKDEIKEIEGVTSDIYDKNFDPFYYWKFPYPNLSPIQMINQRKQNKERIEKAEELKEARMKNIWMESDR
jgi:hypothetical protein